MFAYNLEYGEKQPENNTKLTLFSGKKNVDSPHLGKDGDDVGSTANDKNDGDTRPIQDHRSRTQF